MWFRQIALFRLDPKHLPGFDKLETALAKHPFTACGGLDWYSDGFVPAAPHKPDQMLARAGGAALVTLKREDKVLPAAAIAMTPAEKRCGCSPANAVDWCALDLSRSSAAGRSPAAAIAPRSAGRICVPCTPLAFRNGRAALKRGRT